MAARARAQEREERRRERLDKEAKDLRTVLELRAAELKARSAQLTSASEKGEKLDDALRLQKAGTDKAQEALEATKERVLKHEAELKEQQAINQQRVAENAAKQAELRKTDQEITRVRQAGQTSAKLKEAQQKRLNVIDQERDDLQQQHESLRTQATSLEREIDIEKRETAACKKQAVELRQELEELKSALEKAADSTSRQVAIAKLNASMIKTLEGDVSTYKSESTKHRKMLYQLEKEREKFGSEASSANAKFAAALEEVRRHRFCCAGQQRAEEPSRAEEWCCWGERTSGGGAEGPVVGKGVGRLRGRLRGTQPHAPAGFLTSSALPRCRRSSCAR